MNTFYAPVIDARMHVCTYACINLIKYHIAGCDECRNAVLKPQIRRSLYWSKNRQSMQAGWAQHILTPKICPYSYAHIAKYA